MLRAVIFDFDGVITDSEILHFRSFNQVLSQFNIEITKKDYYREYLGLTDFDVFSMLARQNLINQKETRIEELIRQKNRIFEQLAQNDGKIIDGVREFLELLQKDNIPIAICSGAVLSEIELILDEAKLRSCFSIIVSADHVKKGKPDPEGFLLALKKLNECQSEKIQANQCVVIEDAHWGLEAAEKAGMHTIAITNSYDADQLSQAEKVINNLKQVTIKSLQKLCD